ncbi:MAG TPA: cobalamin B12-binding domain-containing protein [Candidatus Dormibacteraeota bacterium]|nr:cobalamin B12-binding domain-containing protein [Candidatus Dormibacteraeota bacterium]
MKTRYHNGVDEKLDGSGRFVQASVEPYGARPAQHHGGRAGPRRAPVRTFVSAALTGDLATAITLALDFLARTGSRVTVITDLFNAAQLHIGDRWHVGEANVDDEYRVSAAIAAAMAALPEPVPEHRVMPAPTALLTTMQPEEHDLGLHLVAAAFEDDGWLVEMAPGIDGVELLERAWRTRFDLIAISCTHDPGRARAPLSAAVLALHAVGVPVMLGGSAVARAPRLGEQIGADVVAGDVRLAIILARRLLGSRRLRLRARVLNNVAV